MQAEIIAVGTELLLGEIVDTNSSFLAQELARRGIDLFRKQVMGDNKSRLALVLKESLERVDFVILSGGLGPTRDDVTKEAVAEALGEKLTLNRKIYEKIKKRGNYPEKGILRQSMVFPSSLIIENPVGTAPGLLLKKKGKIILLLPGVPQELKETWKKASQWLPQERESIVSKTLKVWGKKEAEVDVLLGDLVKGKNPTVALLVERGEVEVRIRAKFPPQVAKEKIAQIEEKIKKRLRENIFGEDEETLEKVVGRLLKENSLTLSVAESCTGGLISHRITNVPGSSDYFLYSVVAYSNRAKRELLGVPSQILKEKGAVSGEVAERMAEGVKKRGNSKLGIGVTGIAGPAGGTPEKPVGLVYISLSTPREVITQRYIFPGNREEIKWRASSQALDILRRWLKEYGNERERN